jgi:hypothetical protein
MTTASSDPKLWQHIRLFRFYSYFVVASSVAIIYDWALTLGQEIELVWRKRWSPMTVLYLSLRCAGITFIVINMLWTLPSVSLTDTSCTILFYFQAGTAVFVNAMLCVIMISRLYAMYQRSRKILVLLVTFFLVVNIICVVIVASSRVSGVEIVIFGTYQCGFTGGNQHLIIESWMLTFAWEVLTLFLAVWIAVKYLRDLQRLPSARLTLDGCFRVLIKTHVFYFLAYTAVACLTLVNLSPDVGKSSAFGVYVYNGILQIAQVVQMFILGPRLMLSVREHHAKGIDQYQRTEMSTVAFEEFAHESTGSSL